MSVAAEVDTVLEHNQLRVDSVWKLGERARAGDIEAQFCAIIAAGVFTGLRYSLQEYPAALEDLGREVNERRWSRWQQRNARPLDPTAEYEAMRVTYSEADRDVLVEVDQAIRSWEDQLAIPDEEVEMGTQTMKTGGAAAGIPETQDEAALKEAEAAGQALKWDDWLLQSRKVYGRDFTSDQVEKLRSWYQGGLGPVIAVSGLEDPGDQEDAPTRTIDVSITKSTGIVADLTVGKSSSGFCWTGHVELDGKDSANQTNAAPPFECEEAAIDAAFAWLKGWLEQLRELNPSKANKVRKAIAEADIHRVRLIGPWLRNQKAAPAVELSGSGPAAPPESSSIADAVWEHVEAPLNLVDDNPDNTRQNFDDASLAETAESMQLVGQIQACLARRKGDRFQLIDGGRRKRAAAIAGRQTLRLDLVPDSIDDATAIEIMGRANEERKEFDPISRALWFQKLLQVRGCTQEELGNRIRVSQGVISNHLRLLELPDSWRKRLIAREITETHARALIEWKEHPELLTRLDSDLAKEKDGPPPASEWKRWLIDQVYAATRPCQPGAYLSMPGYYGANPLTAELIDQHRLELKIIDAPAQYGRGTEPRALNVKKWDKLVRPLIAAKRKAEAERVTASRERGQAKPAKKEPKGPKADEIASDITNWMRKEIAARLDAKTPRPLVETLFMTFAFSDGGMECEPACKAAGMKGQPGYKDELLAWCRALRKSDDKKRLSIMVAALKYLLGGSYCPFHTDEEREALAEIAADFGVFYDRQWKPTAEVLERFSIDVLRGLPAACRGKDPAKLQRPALVAALVKQWQLGEFPPGYEPKAPEPKAKKSSSARAK